ncbi:MAG: glycosyltransferase [Thermoanaerobaculia bacterium]|nr:glycosyltransferase [Thermoanaerobaculia bacterium]
MRILWIGTKSPWPPIDGGRLASSLTLAALAAEGAELLVVAPASTGSEGVPAGLGWVPVDTRPTPWLRAAARAWGNGGSATLERHRLPAVAREVARQITDFRPQVVHVEQLHALAQAAPAAARGWPVVLRAQNVESDLWRGAAGLCGGLRARWLAAEAQRLAVAEGRAVQQVTTTVALTDEDAARLRALAGPASARVETVPVPHPSELPAASAVAGSPAVVLVGSGGWMPNRAGAEWFFDRVWPRVVAGNAAARLHVFGESSRVPVQATLRPPPADSREAFPAGAILVVPLAVASGVRMKILEAWARGLAVVATPAAAAGLGAVAGRELLVASDPEEFAAAVLLLGAEPERGRELVAAGRQLLRMRHEPARIARRLLAIYEASSSRLMNS